MVNIDHVYQKVLAIANKEQRGYITPQEFNLFADQAQMDIFEQYFYDFAQAERIPKSDSIYGDIASHIDDKISIFISIHNNVIFNNQGAVVLNNVFSDHYKTMQVKVVYRSDLPVLPPSSPMPNPTSITGYAEPFKEKELSDIGMWHMGSALTNFTKSYPAYKMWLGSEKRIQIFPHPDTSTDTVYISYIRKPKTPNWTYVISGDNALYNPTDANYQDFELHSSESSSLVIKILQLAGISLKDYNLAQAAGQKEIATVQQEKR